MRCVSQTGIRRRGVVCPSVPPAVLSRAARPRGQRHPRRLAGRLSSTTGSARWINRLPGPAFAGLPDGFPRWHMRLRRIKRTGSLQNPFIILMGWMMNLMASVKESGMRPRRDGAENHACRVQRPPLQLDTRDDFHEQARNFLGVQLVCPRLMTA